MILGITFEEKILEKITLEKYMYLIKSYGISQLELAPDFTNYDIGFYKKIFTQIETNAFHFNFHLPTFIDENLDVNNFCYSNQKYFINYFNKLNEIFDFKKNLATIVFHGAKYKENTRSEALNKTILFIQFILEIFSRNNFNLTLSIETLNKNKFNIIGDSREDIIKILTQIDSLKLKICWDITHDFLNYSKILYPKGLILNAISHCHIHGFKGNETHLSFSENTQLFPAIKFAKKNDIPINIELLMQDHYLDILEKDILTIQSIN